MIYNDKAINGCSILYNDNVVRFDFEDSVDCGGSNNKVQTGVVSFNLNLSVMTSVLFNIKGAIDGSRTKCESLIMMINGFKVVELYNTIASESPDLLIDEHFEFMMNSGDNNIIIKSTTGDNVSHKSCYWQVEYDASS